MDAPPLTDEPITEALPLAVFRLFIPCLIMLTPRFTEPFQYRELLLSLFTPDTTRLTPLLMTASAASAIFFVATEPIRELPAPITASIPTSTQSIFCF